MNSWFMKLMFLLPALVLLCACAPKSVEKPEPSPAATAEIQPIEIPTALPETPEPTMTAEQQSTAVTILDTQQPKEEPTLTLIINSIPVTAQWEENESVAALTELVKNEPLTIQMSMYGGFEQVGPIGQSLPRDDQQTTTQAGDIVLYSGNQIVVFYGSNSWAYTRLGHITDKTPQELKELLGNGDIAIKISMEGNR